MIIEILAAYLISMAIKKWVLPKASDNNAKQAQFSQFEFPRADEAIPLPIFYGRVRIKGPIVILAKHFKANPIKQKIGGDETTVAYSYQLAIQFLLGAPGKRASSSHPAQLKAMYIGERKVWAGTLQSDGDIRYVNKPDALGGQLQGGGVSGLITFLTGSSLQTNDSFTKKMLTAANANPDVAYRQQSVVTLEGLDASSIAKFIAIKDGRQINFGALYVYYIHRNRFGDVENWKYLTDNDPPHWLVQDLLADTSSNTKTLHTGIADLTPCGWVVGESPRLDGYSFEVRAPCDTVLDGDIFGTVGSEDANPICVLYDLLTNPWDRLGRDAASIDETSFAAAARTLASEGNGMSLVITQAMESREAIRLVLEQIDGVLYDDFSTGLLKLALVREDYDIDDLDTLDPSNVIEVTDWQAGTYEGTFNQVRVTFSDRSKNYEDAPAVAHDQANFYATGEELRSKDIHYPGCTLKTLADKLAARDLRAASLPLASMKLTVDRNAYTKRPGDVFRFTWPVFNGMTDVVFRVLKYNLGKPGSPEQEHVILECIQDRFAYRHSVFKIPVPDIGPVAQTFPSTEHHHMEAPLWVANRAQQAGRVVDGTAGARRLYLAAPRANAVAMHAEVSQGSTDFAQDIEPQPYPGRFRVAVDYERENEPYDTTTGLVIEALEDWEPLDATAEDIALYGKNHLLFVDGDDREEIISFETATDNGDGTWTLNNVGRGKMDTSALFLAAGTRGWVLHNSTGIAVTRVGRVAFDYLQPHTLRHVARGLGKVVNESADVNVDIASGTTVLRHARPYPVADLKGMRESVVLGDSLGKTLAELIEGALSMTWKRRNRLSATIKLGTAADEDPEADTKYRAFAFTRGEDGEINGNVTLTPSTDYTATSLDGIQLGAAGYGEMEVGILSLGDIRANNPAAPREQSNQFPPTLSIDAPDYRNLLRNGRFDQGLDGWETVSGTPGTATSANGLGGTGYYLTGDSGTSDCEVTQTFSIRGYVPGNLSAELQFFHRQITDTTDTITVTLESLDSGSSVLDTIDTGVITPSATDWTRASIEIPALDPSTAYLRVTVLLHDVGGIDGPKCVVTEMILRVGQHTGQLLSHPSFDTFNNITHVIAGWTNVTNYFLGNNSTSPFYEGGQYVTGGNVASSEIRQDVTSPTFGVGYRTGAHAVLELGRMNIGADLDTGEVILEARNGGGAVLDSVTTGAEVIAPSDLWQRRRLVLEIPSDTVTLRVRLLGVRVTGATCDAAFDDVMLDVWKFLDPDIAQKFEFDTPTSQPVPADYDYFDRAWPDITPPTLAFYQGGSEAGMRGTEPPLQTPDELATTSPIAGVTFAPGPGAMGGKFTGAYDATRDGAVTAKAFDFQPGCTGGLTVGDTEFAAIASDDALSIVMEVKIAAEDPQLYVLAGRVGDTGWELAINADGFAVARLIGDGDTPTIEAVGTKFLTDRSVRVIGMVYDPVNHLLSLVDGGDTVTVSTDYSYRHTKTGGTTAWDAGVSSEETILGDGFVELVVDDTASLIFVGLSTSDPDANYATVMYGLYAQSDGFTVYESGALKFTGGAGTIAAGDKLRVRRTGTTITYERNDTVMYTSAAVEANPLLVDTSVFTPGASFVVEFFDDGIKIPVTWQNIINITITAEANVGEIGDETTATLTIGAPTGNGGDILVGQVARCLMWSDALDTADIESMITQGGAPDSHLQQTRSGDEKSTIAVVVGRDETGIVMSRFGYDQFAFAYDDELTSDGGNGIGWPFMFATQNAIPTAKQSQLDSDWATIGLANVTLNYGFGPEGDQSSFLVSGTRSTGRALENITAGASASKTVAFCARADVAHTARLALDNASGVNVENFDYAVTTEWQLFWHTFTAWDNSTPTCRLRWAGTAAALPTTGDVEVAGPFFFNAAGCVFLPGVPITADVGVNAGGYDAASFDLSGGDALVRQHQFEGELQVVGVCPQLPTPPDTSCIFEISAGGSYTRTLYVDNSGEPTFLHGDLAGDVTSAASAQSWDTLWTLRGRWCLAGLLDASSVFAGVIFGNSLSDPSDYGRTAAWTEDGNTPDENTFGSGVVGGPFLPMLLRSVTIRTRERRLAP